MRRTKLALADANKGLPEPATPGSVVVWSSSLGAFCGFSAAFDAVYERLIRYWTEPKVEVGSRIESIEPKCVQLPHPPIYVATYREEGSTASFPPRRRSLFWC